MRMLIALVASVVFSFVYGYAAARSKRAEGAVLPLLDILQSVPVLGLLAVTAEGFIAAMAGLQGFEGVYPKELSGAAQFLWAPGTPHASVPALIGRGAVWFRSAVDGQFNVVLRYRLP